MSPPSSPLQSFRGLVAGASVPMLAATPRGGLMLLVIFFHASGLLALLAIEPFKLVAEEPHRLEVHLVSPVPPPAPAPLETEIPLPEETPPPEFPPVPQLELALKAPEPDLPPPVFQVLAPAPAFLPRVEPPPLPPPPSEPAAARVPQPPHETAPPPKPPAPVIVEALQAAPPSDTRSMLKTVTEADIRYRAPPRPVYPFYAKRAQEFGRAIVNVLIDIAGRPEEVVLEKSSTHGSLDREALRSVRDALFEPYLEDGVPHPVRVSIPVHFVLVYER